MGQGIEQLLTGQGEVKRPLICIEINPPRGTDVEAVLQRYVGVDGIDFVNVTDSALAKLCILFGRFLPCTSPRS